MAETSLWMQKVAADPGHSQWYIERFRAKARAGDDLAGESRLVDAMAPAARTSSMPAAAPAASAGIWPRPVTALSVSMSIRR